MSESSIGWPRSPLVLVLSIVIGLLLGLSTGATVDRMTSSFLPPLGQFAAGTLTAIVVAVFVGNITYRTFARRPD
jgi:hypothetical protein